LDERQEYLKMSGLFLGRYGQTFVAIIIIIYLFGDLAIYAVAVPTTLAAATGQSYHLFLGIFSVVVLPFCFFNFQKTKYLQMATLFTRNLAFFIMIILAIIFISEGNGANPTHIKLFDFSKISRLFGTAVYAFMCHHSLPSIITPIRNKTKNTLYSLMAADVFTVFLAYNILVFTAVFAFNDDLKDVCDGPGTDPCKIQSLYTLNFKSYDISFISFFLTLYPAFTLTTNYPLIAITLRNNVINLLPVKTQEKWRTIVVALVVAGIPLIMAIFTQDVKFLVELTGSYAGLFIMFVIPAALAYFSRKQIKTVLGTSVENTFRSPFANTFWIYLIFFWSFVCLCITIYNQASAK